MEHRLAILILAIVIGIGAEAISPGYASTILAPGRAGTLPADRVGAAPTLNSAPGCFPSGRVLVQYSPRRYSYGRFCLKSYIQGDFRVVAGSLLLGGKSYPVLGAWESLGASAQWMNLTVNFPPGVMGPQIVFGLDWVTGGSCAACGPISWTNHWTRA